MSCIKSVDDMLGLRWPHRPGRGTTGAGATRRPSVRSWKSCIAPRQSRFLVHDQGWEVRLSDLLGVRIQLSVELALDVLNRPLPHRIPLLLGLTAPLEVDLLPQAHVADQLPA